MIVTVDWLRERGACTLGPFEAAFPDGLDTDNPEHIQRARDAGCDMWWAAAYLPVDAIGWAATYPDASVRYWAIKRLPLHQLEWVKTNRSPRLRKLLVRRWPIDDLGWALRSDSKEIRDMASDRITLNNMLRGHRR